jgi:hypothetical protein
MNGKDAIAIFSTRERAEIFIKNNNLKYQIEECFVIGKEPQKPVTVFASHRYIQIDDIHYFIGLYWNYEEARKDGGDNSLVLNLDIDSRK